MTGEDRPLRSVLYVPLSNERALEKLPSLDPDAVILDLEDGVAPARKDGARKRLAGLLKDPPLSRARLVPRVNALDSGWVRDDLAALAGHEGPVLFPKINSAGDVKAALAAMADAGLGSNTLWLMIETAEGVQAVDAIAAASTRTEALVAGTNDLGASLRLPPHESRTGFLYSFSRTILAARAGGLAAIDGVYTDIRNLDGFADEARQARTLGFDGKTLIHPAQIEPCHAVFSPSEEEIRAAERIIAAVREAETRGEGVAVSEGRMVEDLHRKDAERVLRLAGTIRRRGG